MYFEKVTIEKSDSGSQITFDPDSKCLIDASAPFSTNVHDTEYIGIKLGLFGYHDGRLMSTTLNQRNIVKDIDSVIETTPDQIKTARGQIEDCGGIVDNYSDLDIAIMDFQMRSMIAEKAMEINDPWNPERDLKRRSKIAVDYPDFVSL